MSERRRFSVITRLLAVVFSAVAGVLLLAQQPVAVPSSLVPSRVIEAVLNETSGEEAYQHVQMLAVNRNRQPEEYQNEYFETTYLRTLAKQYGLADTQVEFYPTRDVWDAEEADLWLVQPTRRKIASLNMVPTALAQGSTSADVETDVVYVGRGRTAADYAGKDVTGKIVLVNGSVGDGFRMGVLQRGAAGALGTGSAGVSANSAGYTLDQLGWTSVSPRPDKGGFGFVLSLRQFTELRDLLERGEKVVVRAHVKTKTYPGKVNEISASVPGTDPTAGELIAVAHAYETIATPGANDNCTGVATILEVARTLTRLINDGVLPQPRRTIRFIWGPEISGTTAYMTHHPELQGKLIAALNFDMTGADLAATGGYLRMKMTPDSRPSFLNEVLASLLQYVDQTEIRTQQGTNQPFNYRLCPVATITSGSDHSVFNDGGIPAMQFNHWPDNFYHSSHDRIINVDATELKRVSFMAGSAFYYIANAGASEARDLAWEAGTSGQKWIAEVTRQSTRLFDVKPKPADNRETLLAGRYKAAVTKVTGAFNRAKGEVESVLTLSKDATVSAAVKAMIAALESSRDANLRIVENYYKDRCATAGVRPLTLVISEKEREYSTMVPRRLMSVYSEDAQKRQQQLRQRRTDDEEDPSAPATPAVSSSAAAAPAPAANQAAQPQRPAGRRGTPGLPGMSSGEMANFIDGNRSILDIYNAVRAECGNLVTGQNDTKFAYLLSPDAEDVDLEAVATALRNMEKVGLIEIQKKAAGTESGKTKKQQ